MARWVWRAWQWCRWSSRCRRWSWSRMPCGWSGGCRRSSEGRWSGVHHSGFRGQKCGHRRHYLRGWYRMRGRSQCDVNGKDGKDGVTDVDGMSEDDEDHVGWSGHTKGFTTGFSSYTYRSCVVPIQARVQVSHEGIKRLSSSNELGAQYVSPHQTTIKRKEHHTCKTCACL